MSASPIEVRVARPDEYAAIGAMTYDAYEASGILGTDPGYIGVLKGAERRAAGSELLVAVIDDAVVGSVMLCRYGTEYAEISEPGEAEFRMLAVEPTANGRGVGRRLIDECALLAHRDGAHRLVLSVIDHNERAAKLYEHLGFERLPDRDWEPVKGVLLRVWGRKL